MRSIRVRLLLMLLALVTFVVGGLSWYVYEQTNYLLQAKELATAELLRNQCEKRCKDYRDQFQDRMIHQAERIGRQVYEKVELSPVLPMITPLQTTHILGSLATALANPDLSANYLAAMAQASSSQNSRVFFHFFAKRTIVLQDRVLDGDEYYYISTQRASVRSDNLPEDCFVPELSRTYQLQHYEPMVNEQLLSCGKRFCMVTLRLPLAYETIVTGGLAMGRIPPLRRSATSFDRTIPRSSASMVIQVARVTDARDSMIASFREETGRELAALRQESEKVRKDTLNRLILICLATISLCALAITWLSRASLAPLVNVADAVTDLTPRDLRLKLHGKEIDPDKLPEELSPIVMRLQESLDSLEHAFAREKRATADISHELRTPLAALMTTAQVSLRKPRTPEEYRATLKQCVETGTHMTTLVERLLVLSRLDAGVDPIKKEEIDIVELAGQCVDMLRPLADQRQISIELDVDESASNLSPQISDAGKLREILLNLIDNAVHYNREEGQVTVRLSASSKSLMIEVIDTGMGMSEETRQHLFERFYRADPSRQSASVNAGLGLAIVKGYVDLFGGTISVTSEEGKGSTFRITLPKTNSCIPVTA